MGVELLEDLALGLGTGVDGEEGDLTVLLGHEDRHRALDVFQEAMPVVHGDLDVGERMFRVLDVPLLVIPNADQIERLEFPAGRALLEKECLAVGVAGDDPDGAILPQGDAHCRQRCR